MDRLLYRFQRLLPQAAPQKEGARLHRELTAEATWTINYVVLIISSCAIATLGLIGNSTAVIIGAMLIAPLMLPIRAIAFAALEGDFDLLRSSCLTALGGTILAVALSTLLGWVTPIPAFGSEFQARVEPNLVDLGIAIAAGGISGFAKVRQGISDALAGTAIAVALMPPLCVVGLSLSKTPADPRFWLFSQGALLLYLTNLLGIILACMVVFILAGYTGLSRSIGLAFLATLVLAVPLGTNFAELMRKARVRDFVEQLLVRSTITIGQQDVTLLSTRIDWSRQPEVVYLTVQTGNDITPQQVRDIESFVSRRVGQPLRFVLFISNAKIVTADGVERPGEETVLPRDPALPLKIKPPATESTGKEFVPPPNPQLHERLSQGG